MTTSKGIPRQINSNDKLIRIRIDNRVGKCKNCDWHPAVCQFCQLSEDVKDYIITTQFKK